MMFLAGIYLCDVCSCHEILRAQRTRVEIMLTKDTFIAWPYKIVTGKQGGKGIWTGTRSPNATKVKDDDPGCGSMPDDLDETARSSSRSLAEDLAGKDNVAVR